MRDGHIHSPFCPHGTKDSLVKYVETAIELGLKEITFTEHAPLPTKFADPAPTGDSAMKMKDLPIYIKQIQALKKEFSPMIKINVGLEVDYIGGFEEETASLLNEYGPSLDDSILSVHFLSIRNKWFCLDYSPKMFEEMVIQIGSIERLYALYYQILLDSIHSDLGPYKPNRIGHMTLVHKFQTLFPCSHDFTLNTDRILYEMKEKNVELDYNSAGLFKEYCQETYPPRVIAEKALTMGIPLIPGSDAHQAKDLAQGFHTL